MPKIFKTTGLNTSPPGKLCPPASCFSQTGLPKPEWNTAFQCITDVDQANHLRPMRLLRMNEVVWRTGFQRSYLYLRIRDKSFPPPIHVGVSARFLESEVVAVQQTWSLGKTREEVRKLVADLVAAR